MSKIEKTKFPFSYTVVVCDGLTDNKYNLESGMGVAKSFTNAMKQIEDYYGEDLVEVKGLTLYEENRLIIVPKRVIQEYEYNAENLCYPGVPCDIHGYIFDTPSKKKEKRHD